MKYSYRGVEYNHVSPSLELSEMEIIGDYRGTPCRRRHFVTTHLSPPTHGMKYRGVEYGAQQMTEVGYEQEATPQIPDVVPISISVGSAMGYSISSHRLGIRDVSELEKVHNTFIRQTLEHRLAIAKRKGDQGLVQMLELEQHQFN